MGSPKKRSRPVLVYLLVAGTNLVVFGLILAVDDDDDDNQYIS